jgi:hypothetical protein
VAGAQAEKELRKAEATAESLKQEQEATMRKNSILKGLITKVCNTSPFQNSLFN